MATSPSPRLGLARALSGHGFSRSETANNWSIVDLYPGVYICEFASRPTTWGAAHEGMLIWESDRALLWRWNGTVFVRQGPVGLLGEASITADVTTASTTPQPAITKAVTIPATDAGSTTKRIKIEGSWYSMENGTATTLGLAEVALVRGSTVLKRMRVRGRPDTAASELDRGIGGTIVVHDAPAAGAQTYHLSICSIASIGGTTVMKASATTPASLSIEEVGL